MPTNLAIDDRQYDDAISLAHRALHTIKESPNPTLLGYQALNTLLTLGMQALQSMPYNVWCILFQKPPIESHV